ncbi:unnamed protein product, partial [Didymodactylos carnosus]
NRLVEFIDLLREVMCGQTRAVGNRDVKRI